MASQICKVEDGSFVPKVAEPSSFGNNGTLNGAASCSKSVQDRLKYGCQFDGRNESFINVNDSAGLNITDEITISAWVKIQ